METTIVQTDYTTHTLIALAYAIRRDWRKVNYAAAPYLQAMCGLASIESKYGYDDGRSIVLYFLSNAASWRGPVAKAIKAELKRRVK